MKKLVVMMSVLLILASAFALCVNATEKVVYISDAGSDANDGTSSGKAVATLAKAYSLLPDGGTLVVCGVVNIDTAYATPMHTGTVKVTSVYGGVDYRTVGAQLKFSNNLYLNGNATFKDIVFYVNVANKAISCNSNKVVFDTGIECLKPEGTNATLSIVAGSFDTTSSMCDDTKPTDLTINSGVWNTLRGANRATASSQINGDVKLTINGGTFNGRVSANGNSGVNGNIYFTINGGTFNNSVSGSCINNEAKGAVKGNVTMVINGGTFAKNVMLCDNYGDKVSGTGTLTITGGEFADATVIIGSGCGAGSTVDISGCADIQGVKAILTDFTNIVTGQPSDTDNTPKDTTIVTTDDTTAKDTDAQTDTAAVTDTVTDAQTDTVTDKQTSASTTAVETNESTTPISSDSDAGSADKDDGGDGMPFIPIIMGVAVFICVGGAVAIAVKKKKN